MFKLKDILRDEEGGGGSDAGGDGGSSPTATQDASASSSEGSPTSSSRSIFQSDPSGSEQGQEGNGDGSGQPKVTDTRPKPEGDVMSKPFHIGLYDESGKLDKAAFERLPDHLKKDKQIFEQYDTLADLLHAFGNSKRLNGRKGDLSAYERPGDDAPDSVKEQHQQFLKVANGVPEKPEDYGLSRPEGVPEDQWNQEQANEYAGIFHKHNASPELVREISELNNRFQAEQQQRMQQEDQAYFADEVSKLKAEFKSELPEVRGFAERVVSRFGMDDSAMSSAANVKALYRIGKALGEDRLPSGDGNRDSGMTDRQKALDIVNNPNNPMHKAFHNPNHPEHDEAVAYRSKLNQNWLASQKGGR